MDKMVNFMCILTHQILLNDIRIDYIGRYKSQLAFICATFSNDYQIKMKFPHKNETVEVSLLFDTDALIFFALP